MTTHRHCCCSTNACVLPDLPWRCENPAHCYVERTKPLQLGSTIVLIIDITTDAAAIPTAAGGTVSGAVTIHIEGSFELVSGRTGCTWRATTAYATVPAAVISGELSMLNIESCIEIQFAGTFLSFTNITIRPTEYGALDDIVLQIPNLYQNITSCDQTSWGLRFVAVSNDLNSIVPASVSHKYFWQLGGSIDGTGASDTLLGGATIATTFDPIEPLEDYSWLGLTGSSAIPDDAKVRALSLRYTNWCGARTYYSRITGFRYRLDDNEPPEDWYQCEGLYPPCPAYIVTNTPVDQVLCLSLPCSGARVLDGFDGFCCVSGTSVRTYPSGTYVVTTTPTQWGYQCIPFNEGTAGYTFTSNAGVVRYQPGLAPVVLAIPNSTVSSTWYLTASCHDCGDPCENDCVTVQSYPQGGSATWALVANPAQT